MERSEGHIRLCLIYSGFRDLEKTSAEWTPYAHGKILAVSFIWFNKTDSLLKNEGNGEKIDLSNRCKPWTDSELKLILSDAPTRKNALKHAKFFKRGCGSILQIYRWAHMTKEAVRSKRSQDAFVVQIARVAKEIGSV